MKRLIREGVEDLIPYPPGKPIEELEREMGITGSIKLASNENPLGPSPLALEAVRRALPSLHRYPDGSGYYLKERLMEKFGVPMDRILLGNGSNELVELVVRTFLSPGEEAVQAFPTFLMYEKIVKGAGGKMVSVPLKGFLLDLEGLLRALGTETKLLFVTNPNNPTGTAIDTKAMQDFLDRVPRDILVILDEAYIEFARDPGVADGLRLLDRHPLLVVLRTCSKICGLAGLRVGYGFTSSKVADYMDRVRQPFNVNTLAQVGARAALDDQAFMDRSLACVREGLAYLYGEMERLGLEYVPTQTNFFLVKVPGGGRALYRKMLKQGVIIRAMDAYGLPEYVRISVGLPEENRRFVETLDRLLRDKG